jgi:hypothetical protein
MAGKKRRKWREMFFSIFTAAREKKVFPFSLNSICLQTFFLHSHVLFLSRFHMIPLALSRLSIFRYFAKDEKEK